MKKYFVSMTICLLLVVTLFAPLTSTQAELGLSDIQQSTHKAQIEELYHLGIIQGTPEGDFQPTRPLTKAEAATMLVRGFNLSPIHPIEKKEETMSKTTTYADPLGVIDDSFSIPSADDIEGHWALSSIEGLLKVRADQVNDQKYQPTSTISKKAWIEMLGKIIFGADQAIDYTKEMVEAGLASSQLAESSESITREEAVASLHRILTNPEFKIITIFATSDIHAHLEPYVPNGAESEIGGLAKMSQVINEARQTQPHTLLVDGGDAPYNTNIGNLTEGASTIDVMNAMQYDAMVLGNHDFDFPFEVLERNAGHATFPFLSANTLYQKEQPDFLASSVIKEVAGLRIGIVGVTDDKSHYYTHPKNVEGITFEEQFEAAQKAVDEIREETDLMIGLSHLHGNNQVLPTKVEGLDIVLGGGQDIVDFPKKIGSSWLISPGKHAETLNQINVQVLNGEMIGMNFAHIFMTYNLEEDPEVATIIERYSNQIGEKMKAVVGTTLINLDGERQTVRLKESNLGNLVADSLRDLTGADIALQNGGSIRASIGVGEMTLEDIYSVLPFDNTVVMVEATGQTIWDALEHGVSTYPAAAGGFLQVSGLEYTFDAAQEPGSRIIEVTINGTPIDKEKTYKVAANDFLTGGGDMFDMLKDETTEILKTKHYLRDALTEYLEQNPTVNPQLEGRIHVLNPQEQE
ncbi:5'-nucleotidase C-terminal domain-containing protein [Bacillus horti]|uniref:2',3'-cyclic-nucleotide 2'-phosphodiesterase (5'-nucleotidase family) n=1 Tax=Caldalkalibacillus horti TaxID=77523 RepID=A0ABT9W194_9BACI|nr:5'-nucleotidase C-terminal domain-containing protein [Bacillus horti]MDQ0167020.1 2',3'-cyclic-nucleotide 2'-phosphodiesterase (5'-nucleotidase family) [Bacillus horti]